MASSAFSWLAGVIFGMGFMLNHGPHYVAVAIMVIGAVLGILGPIYFDYMGLGADPREENSP